MAIIMSIHEEIEHKGTDCCAEQAAPEALVTVQPENLEAADSAVSEEFTEMVKQLAEIGKKIIIAAPLQMQQRAKVDEALALLEELKKEVIAKKEEALGKSAVIKARVDDLVTSGKVQINRDEYAKSEESVQQYAGLLDNIVTEISNEEARLTEFLNPAIEFTVVAFYESDDFVACVEEKVNIVRKYVRNIKKDLNVSFSRYSFGFEAQMKRILHVESYIRYQDVNENASQLGA